MSNGQFREPSEETYSAISRTEEVRFSRLHGTYRHVHRRGGDWDTCLQCGDLVGFRSPRIRDLDLIVSGCSDYKSSLYPHKGVSGERYRPEKRIGAGGYGIVHRARSRRNLRVAIKWFLGRSVDQRREHWTREIEPLRGLQHPHVLEMLDIGNRADEFFIVYELAKHDLRHQVRTHGPVTDGQCLELCRQLLEALRFLHARRIIHRDVTPANVLYMPTGAVKLADLGIARVLQAEQQCIPSSTGTPAYLAPEALRGLGHGFGADLYQAGLLLAYARSGRCPIGEHLTAQQVRRQIERGVTTTFVTQLNCDPKLRDLISILVRPTPQSRFRCAADALAFLENGLQPAYLSHAMAK